MIYCNEINEYIKFVEDNPNETDDEIKLLIKNIVKPTLSRDDVFFDEETFKKAILYCENGITNYFLIKNLLMLYFLCMTRTIWI